MRCELPDPIVITGLSNWWTGPYDERGHTIPRLSDESKKETNKGILVYTI